MPQTSERSMAPASSRDAAAFTPASVRGSTRSVVLLTLVGAVLRLWHLGAKSLWFDEPLTVAIARLSWPSFARLWWYGEAAYQGAYFLLMRGWLRLGDSEAWIRLPSAIFAIASIPLIYVVARKLIGEKAALAAAVLLAFSPTDVYYSQEARGYTLTIFLVLLSASFFVRAVEENRERDWLLWTVLSALAVYSHFFACLVVIAQAASLLVLRKPGLWRRMLLHAALIVFLTAPGLPFIFRGTPTQDPSLLQWPRASPKELLHLASFLGGSGEKLILSAILWIAAVRSIWRERVERDREIFWRGALLVSWTALPIVILGLVSIINPLFVQRYLIFCLPATVMLAARGMTALPQRRLGLWLVVALCVFSLVNVFMGYSKPREDWRSAAAAVFASAAPGDAVVIFPFFARTGFDYYYDLHRADAPTLQTFPRFYDRGEEQQDFDREIGNNSHTFRHVWILMRDQGPAKNSLQEYAPDLATKLESIFGEPRVTRYQGITMLEFGS
jgi:mannosyltransferase